MKKNSGQALKKVIGKQSRIAGQALIETVLFLPLFATLFFAVAWHWRIESARLALVSAAKYGTELIVHKNLPPESVASELTELLCSGRAARLDKKKLKIAVRVGRVVPPPAFDPELSAVEISYEFDIPEWLGSKYVIRGKSYVLNDSFSTFFGIPDRKNHS